MPPNCKHVLALRLQAAPAILVFMAVAVRFVRQVVRLAIVFGLAAIGLLTYLGRPFVPDTCPHTGVTCQIANVPVVQPSLVNRFGLMTQGYWPIALLAAVGVACGAAVRRSANVSADPKVPESVLGRMYC